MLAKYEKALLWCGFIGLIFFRYGNYWSEHWYGKFAGLMALACIPYAIWFGRRTSLGLTPFLLYALLSGMWVGVWPFNEYMAEPDIGYREALGRDALYGSLCLILSTLWIALHPDRWRPLLPAMLRFLWGISVAYTLYEWVQFPHAPNERGGFSGNPSMNGLLIACLLPFVLSRVGWKGQITAILVTLAALLATVSSIPMGCLAVVLVVYYRPQRLWQRLGVACLPPLLLGIGLLTQGDAFLNASGRFEAWGRILGAWSDDPLYEGSQLYLGSGLGTTTHVGGAYQMKHPSAEEVAMHHQNLFWWFHNEYLQTFFELGWVGLWLALIAWGRLVWQARRSRVLLASLLAFSGGAFFNYPLRLPLHCVALVFIAALILRDGETPDTAPSASSVKAP